MDIVRNLCRVHAVNLIQSVDHIGGFGVQFREEPFHRQIRVGAPQIEQLLGQTVNFIVGFGDALCCRADLAGFPTGLIVTQPLAKGTGFGIEAAGKGGAGFQTVDQVGTPLIMGGDGVGDLSPVGIG